MARLKFGMRKTCWNSWLGLCRTFGWRFLPSWPLWLHGRISRIAAAKLPHQNHRIQTESLQNAMRFRKLRIAISAVCGVASLLLIALWVRSYRINHVAVVPVGKMKVGVQYAMGRFVFVRAAKAKSFQQRITDPQAFDRILRTDENSFGVAVHQDPNTGLYSIQMPCWWFVALASTLAFIPWITSIRWRFSLYTVFIIITIVAFSLGVITLLIQ